MAAAPISSSQLQPIYKGKLYKVVESCSVLAAASGYEFWYLPFFLLDIVYVIKAYSDVGVVWVADVTTIFFFFSHIAIDSYIIGEQFKPQKCSIARLGVTFYFDRLITHAIRWKNSHQFCRTSTTFRVTENKTMQPYLKRCLYTLLIQWPCIIVIFILNHNQSYILMI